MSEYQAAYERIDWAGYRVWLSEQYALATARKGVTDLRTYLRDPSKPRDPSLTYARQKDYVWAFETFNWYCSETSAQAPLPVHLRPPEPAPPPKKGRRNVGRRKRKEPQLVMGREAFVELRRLIREDPHATAPALDVITHTGLRTQDVLRTPRRAIEEAFARPDRRIVLTLKTGKKAVMALDAAPTSWERLHRWVRAQGVPNVAASCSPRAKNPNPDTDGAAYKACDRRFKRLCKLAGVHGRHNLHRARHTLATFARELAELTDVRDTLGHKDTATTDLYTEQARAAVAARTLRKVNEQLGSS